MATNEKNLPPNFISLRPDNELITLPELQALNVAINTRFFLYTCCGSAWHASNLAAHLQSNPQHPDLVLTREIRELIETLAVSCNIASEYPAHEAPQEPIITYAGLNIVRNLFGCGECGYTASKKVVTNHLKSSAHKGKPLAGFQGQMFNPSTRSYFRTCDPPAPPAPTNIFLTELENFDWRTVHSGEEPNARMVSPLLMYTKWHLDVLPHQGRIEELRNLVATPKEDDELAWVAPLVHGYFQYATNLIDATDELVLQRLNSHDPDKQEEIVNMQLEME
ncbi:hypothetical protein FB45DRAFT_863926 [Roridomyces roridus]|uniref:C2H2-type domain-containing protein n=1 Tax=Roridomyces roridus TaxID=1738132 RepID=A0AAD7FRL1_9AGAR|nr:hypothetical protein FB45DRAFT_863926 [Roridomyces roridus]